MDRITVPTHTTAHFRKAEKDVLIMGEVLIMSVFIVTGHSIFFIFILLRYHKRIGFRYDDRFGNIWRNFIFCREHALSTKPYNWGFIISENS